MFSIGTPTEAVNFPWGYGYRARKSDTPPSAGCGELIPCDNPGWYHPHVYAINSQSMRTLLVPPTLVSFLSIAAIASGQSSPVQMVPKPTPPVTMESISIYITPVMRKDTPLPALKAEDLTITEDKAPAKVDRISCGRPDPILIGILVDVSASRSNDSHLVSHYNELQTFLGRVLTGHDGAYVVAFNEGPFKLSELTADPAALTAAFDQLTKLGTKGATALYDAIKAAANANFFGRADRRILVVVSDWEDDRSRLNLKQVTEVAERTSTTVYAIIDQRDYATKLSGRVTELASSAAKEVARETGGLSFNVKGENEFAMALQAIQIAISGYCRVDYSIPRVASSKNGIKLQVTSNLEGISIYYPKTRFAAAQ